jgi:hypothetical protein
MLLNEVQRLEAKVDEQATQLQQMHQLKLQVAALQKVDEQATQLQQMHQLKLQVAALQAAMAKLADSDRRVASR